MEIEKEQLIHQIRRECKQEKDVIIFKMNCNLIFYDKILQELIDIQEKLQRDLNENQEIQRRLNEKIHDLERKNENLQSTIHELRETVCILISSSLSLSIKKNSSQITMNDRDHQIKLTSLDDENQRLKLKHKEDIKDHELITNRDIQRLKEAHLSTEQTLKEQITKLENIRTSLERVELYFI